MTQAVTLCLPHHWAGGGAGGSDRGANSMTTHHSAPPTSLGWGRGRGVRQRGKQHDNTRHHSAPPTSLGWGRGARGAKSKVNRVKQTYI